MDSIREVDTAIAVEVQQDPVPGITDSAILAGKPLWCPKEEMPEETDGIGEVDLSILVRVARLLEAARCRRRFSETWSRVFECVCIVYVYEIARFACSDLRAGILRRKM